MQLIGLMISQARRWHHLRLTPLLTLLSKPYIWHVLAVILANIFYLQWLGRVKTISFVRDWRPKKTQKGVATKNEPL